MATVLRGVKDAYAVCLYQPLVSSSFVHVLRMLTLHYYRLSYIFVFKLSKRDLNSLDGLGNAGWVFVKNVDLIRRMGIERNQYRSANRRLLQPSFLYFPFENPPT